MKQVILIGEIRIGERGAIHQKDFAAALECERLTGWPKDATDVEVIVGRLLANRKPAMLIKAEKNSVPVKPVADVLNDDVRGKLVTLLTAKPKLETYESAALETLKASIPAKIAGLDHQVLADVFPMPPKRGKKKVKTVAAG